MKTYSTLFEQLEEFEKDFSVNMDNGIKSMVCKYFAGDCCQEKANRGFYVVLEDIRQVLFVCHKDKWQHFWCKQPSPSSPSIIEWSIITSNNLSNEIINTGVSREIIFQK